MDEKKLHKEHIAVRADLSNVMRISLNNFFHQTGAVF